MTNAIRILTASKHYTELLASFSTNEKLKVDLNDRELSEAIYFHICKMKYAGWRHRVDFKRGRKHPFPEFFQDIIAFYLRASLPEGYEIELEHKEGKTQPDIAIKRGHKYVFLIEVKTNVGWARLDKNTKSGIEAIEHMADRREKLAENFRVDKQNIIYIFEDHSNVNKEFSAKYWDGKKRKPRPTDFPFSIIFPLFDATDPLYWKWEEGEKRFERTKHYKKISDEQIQDRAKRSIVTPFEEILGLIINNHVL